MEDAEKGAIVAAVALIAIIGMHIVNTGLEETLEQMHSCQRVLPDYSITQQYFNPHYP